jgi:hypothetical protein
LPISRSDPSARFAVLIPMLPVALLEVSVYVAGVVRVRPCSRRRARGV